MSYEIYLFDFDYTLGDSTPGITESVNYALARMGFPLAKEKEIRSTIGRSLPEMFVLLTKNEKADLGMQFSKYFLEKADQIMLGKTELFGDTGNVLNFLWSKGRRLGIVTTKYRTRIIQILKKCELSHLIEIIIGGEDVVSPKPDPEALLKAVQLFGSKKENIIYLGDSSVDALAAQGAKIDFIGVTTGATTRGELEQLPHIAIIDSLSELIKMMS